MSTATSHFVQTNNIKLHYRIIPQPGKKQLLLLHGLTANAHAFDGLVKEGLNEDFELIIPDMRGRGKSDKPAFRYSFKEHALDIIGLLDALNISMISVAGHSFGGLLSLYLASHYPHRIHKVILLDSAAEMNPNTFEMLSGTLSRLDKVFPSYEDYIHTMQAAPHNTFWTEEMYNYYNADILRKESGEVVPIPNLTNIYRIISHVATEPWKKYLPQIPHQVLLLNGCEEYAMGEPILPDFKAKETVAALENGQYISVDGNHQTMLYGTGAQQIVKSLRLFLNTAQVPGHEPNKRLNVAVVGATGVVGQQMLKTLEERDFPINKLFAVASEKSLGKTITFRKEDIPVITPEMALEEDIHIALFSAGSEMSLKYAPLFANKNITVIDNSSAWRMDPSKKLVIPEVNANVLTPADKIIANPNCSTIQMLVALKPLHDAFNIRRVVVSTYQSVSGSGIKGINQLHAEAEGHDDIVTCYPHPIHQNVIPHIDSFLDNGYTKEEMKMILETQKIMGDDSIQVSPTTVRVPVKVGHSESVNIEFTKDFELKDIISTLNNAPGIKIVDMPAANIYPMPIEAEGSDEVLVGRIRKDLFQKRTINCWIVADNLRKGAATNAVQIAEIVAKKFYSSQY